jgi:phenylpyruvate tautomerase PptA (4-oxalocrotonate tautomerase family)
MPLWHLCCPQNAYSADDKQAIAERITDIYVGVDLPRFYVSVIFHDVPNDSFFIGGKPTNDFVRVWIDQIARSTAPEHRPFWLERVSSTLDPFVKARGYRWEIHIDQTPIDFWSVQGLKPLDAGSDAEKRWIEEDRVSPYA